MPPRVIALICAVAALAGPAAAAAPASRRPPARRTVPQGFVGVTADGPMLDGSAGVGGGEYARMASAGVESVRVVLFWSRMQPYRSVADVPPPESRRYRTLLDGVPTDLAPLDATVRAAASRGLPLMPVVLGAPRWAALDPGSRIGPPRDPGLYARFLTALVGRYGPRGAFWRENPTVRRTPIRDWQVWNEPNLTGYWPAPFDTGPSTVPRNLRSRFSYPALLEAAYRAIKRADRGATVVLAGLTNLSWEALDDVYRALRGRGRWFDRVAVQSYTWLPGDVIRVVRNVRAVMRRHGDARKPIMWTELNWPAACRVRDCDPGRNPSARPADLYTRASYGIETDDRGMASKLRDALTLLARDRRAYGIAGVYVYTWMSRYASREDPFDYSGLRDHRRGRPADRPAMAAFRAIALRLEGCRSGRKATVTRCAR